MHPKYKHSTGVWGWQCSGWEWFLWVVFVCVSQVKQPLARRGVWQVDGGLGFWLRLQFAGHGTILWRVWHSPSPV